MRERSTRVRSGGVYILKGERYVLADMPNPIAVQDDYGWKLINGDVFRVPQYRDLLCAILGMQRVDRCRWDVVMCILYMSR